jgi:hypothetical protein
MGVTLPAAEFLLRARKQGLELGRAVTVGRQWLMVSPFETEKLLRKSGLWPGLSREQFLEQIATIPSYLDPLLKMLGATSVSALDISAFEGATLLHDLNKPIPDEWKSQYDFLFDGGSLEHIFNFPQAIQNYCNLLRPGGSMILFTVANNFCGHGFYQFSPELFYRVLSKENGFEVKRLVLAEDDVAWSRLGGFSFPVNVPGAAYSAADPAQIHNRVELVNRRQTTILVEARKIAERPLFVTIPQQSDYVAAWDNKKEADLNSVKNRARGLFKLVRIINPFLLRRWRGAETFSNKKAYQRISW